MKIIVLFFLVLAGCTKQKNIEIGDNIVTPMDLKVVPNKNEFFLLNSASSPKDNNFYSSGSLHRYKYENGIYTLLQNIKTPILSDGLALNSDASKFALVTHINETNVDLYEKKNNEYVKVKQIFLSEDKITNISKIKFIEKDNLNLLVMVINKQDIFKTKLLIIDLNNDKQYQIPNEQMLDNLTVNNNLKYLTYDYLPDSNLLVMLPYAQTNTKIDDILNSIKLADITETNDYIKYFSAVILNLDMWGNDTDFIQKIAYAPLFYSEQGTKEVVDKNIPYVRYKFNNLFFPSNNNSANCGLYSDSAFIYDDVYMNIIQISGWKEIKTFSEAFSSKEQKNKYILNKLNTNLYAETKLLQKDHFFLDFDVNTNENKCKIIWKNVDRLSGKSFVLNNTKWSCRGKDVKTIYEGVIGKSAFNSIFIKNDLISVSFYENKLLNFVNIKEECQ